jgi:hypothetical protein
MANQEIILVVGIATLVLGFIAGRKSQPNFSVDNQATDYVIDIEVHPAKHKLVIKRITPKNK